MEHTCKTCRFYDPFPDRPSMGRCRRHAPRPGTTAHWPSVNDFDWCGEWQEKPQNEAPTSLMGKSAGISRDETRCVSRFETQGVSRFYETRCGGVDLES